MLPRAALEHERTQQRTSDVVVKGLRKVWRAMRGKNWDRTWKSTVGPQVLELATEAQQTSAAQTDAYVAAVLAELNIPTETSSSLNLAAFAGVAGDGRPLDSGLYGAVIHTAKAQYSPDLAGRPAQQVETAALASGQAWLEEYVETLLADAARAAEAVAIAQRPWIDGWVRMIEPGACSRCVVLAGKFYLFNEGFLRHPSCKCRHIPATEDTRDDTLTNPHRYFESLTKKQQDEVFTTAGAEAVRLGADVTQVVNARRGMSTAQQNPRGWIPKGRLTPVDVYGHPTYITTEGVTKRGVGRKAMGTGRPVRLMPESILELAKDRSDAIRLLKLYGYIT